MPYISMGLYASDKKFYLADASSQLYRPLSYYLAKVPGGERRAAARSVGSGGARLRVAGAAAPAGGQQGVFRMEPAGGAAALGPRHRARLRAPFTRSSASPCQAPSASNPPQPAHHLSLPRPPHPPTPAPRPPQISAITPFQIISACVFGFTVYGMAGLRSGAGSVLKAGLINTLMYLIASQVGAPACSGRGGGRGVAEEVLP